MSYLNRQRKGRHMGDERETVVESSCATKKRFTNSSWRVTRPKDKAIETQDWQKLQEKRAHSCWLKNSNGHFKMGLELKKIKWIFYLFVLSITTSGKVSGVYHVCLSKVIL